VEEFEPLLLSDFSRFNPVSPDFSPVIFADIFFLALLLLPLAASVFMVGGGSIAGVGAGGGSSGWSGLSSCACC